LVAVAARTDQLVDLPKLLDAFRGQRVCAVKLSEHLELRGIRQDMELTRRFASTKQRSDQLDLLAAQFGALGKVAALILSPGTEQEPDPLQPKAVELINRAEHN